MNIDITGSERALLILALNGWTEKIVETITVPEKLEEMAPLLKDLETITGKLREAKEDQNEVIVTLPRVTVADFLGGGWAHKTAEDAIRLCFLRKLQEF